MKKVLHFLGVATILSLLLIFSRCSKSDSTPPICATCSSSPAPSIAASASPDTVWYGGTTQIDWAVTNATSVSISGGTISGTSGVFTTPTLLIPTSFTITATGPGGSTSKQINVYVWSQRTTQLCNYGHLHMTIYRSCIAGTENLPTAIWYPGPIDPALWIQFNVKGHADTNLGPNFWSWQNNENSILFSGIDLWGIILNSNGIKRTQVKNGYYTEQVLIR